MAQKNPNSIREVAVPDTENLALRLNKCFGCYWADPNNIRPVSNATLADCSGHPSTKQRLASLRKRGIIESSLVEDNGVQRNLYRPTNTAAGREFTRKLPKGPCKKENAVHYVSKCNAIAAPLAVGTTTPEELAEANRGAEQFLLGLHHEPRGPAQTRRHMLGCLACHLFGETGQVAKGNLTAYTQRSDTAVRDLFFALHNLNILAYVGKMGKIRMQNTFQLATTPRAQEFAELLTPPKTCDFKTAQQQAEMPPALEDGGGAETVYLAPGSPSNKAAGTI